MYRAQHELSGRTSLKRSIPVTKAASGLRARARCIRASCRRSGLRLGSFTSTLNRAALQEQSLLSRQQTSEAAGCAVWRNMLRPHRCSCFSRSCCKVAAATESGSPAGASCCSSWDSGEAAAPHVILGRPTGGSAIPKAKAAHKRRGEGQGGSEQYKTR